MKNTAENRNDEYIALSNLVIREIEEKDIRNNVKQLFEYCKTNIVEDELPDIDMAEGENEMLDSEVEY